jgi:hypothetical protein
MSFSESAIRFEKICEKQIVILIKAEAEKRAPLEEDEEESDDPDAAVWGKLLRPLGRKLRTILTTFEAEAEAEVEHNVLSRSP